MPRTPLHPLSAAPLSEEHLFALPCAAESRPAYTCKPAGVLLVVEGEGTVGGGCIAPADLPGRSGICSVEIPVVFSGLGTQDFSPDGTKRHVHGVGYPLQDERIARLEEACAAYEAAAGLHAKQNTPANAAMYQDTQQLLGECKQRLYDLQKCKIRGRR
eukprot:8958496-Pyramimonas_sp.AAC.1